MPNTILPDSVDWKLKFENKNLEKDFIKDYDLNQRSFYLLGVYLSFLCWVPAIIAVILLQWELLAWASISILPLYSYLTILIFIFKKDSLLGKYQNYLFIAPIFATITAIYWFQFLLDIEKPYSGLIALITIQIFCIFIFRLRVAYAILLILISTSAYFASFLFIPTTQSFIILNIGAIFNFVIIMVLTAYYFERSARIIFLQKRLLVRENQIVGELNTEIQQINEELNTSLTALNLQQKEIVEKNKDIEDSIVYAQRIQKALFPFEETLSQYIEANQYFVLFKPRDIVSGDFYFLQEVEGLLFVICADCTGHGVPGAMMSILGMNLLEEEVVFKKIKNADDLLNRLHVKIRHLLKQQDTHINDGIDLAVLIIDKEHQTAQFAGAKSSLIYIQNNELYQIKGDKMPIGGEQHGKGRIFTKHSIDISQQITFYLFSDGYQDQFGGTNNKKFMLSQMEALFLEIHSKPMQEQHLILDNAITNWMMESNEKQIDDILVMGIRL